MGRHITPFPYEGEPDQWIISKELGRILYDVALGYATYSEARDYMGETSAAKYRGQLFMSLAELEDLVDPKDEIFDDLWKNSEERK